MSRGRPLLRLVIATAAVLLSTGGAAADWPTYHQNQARTGVDSTSSGLNVATHIWSAQVDAAQYAEPVTIGNTVIVATENDSVYAFDITSGRELWVKHVATPLTNVGGVTGCGDIDPLGITGTPVVDGASRTVYVVAEEASPAGQHELFALNLDTGVPRWSVVLDGPMTVGGAHPNDPKEQQQRGALGFANGRVYVPFGGLAGDCGNYHGWVIGIDASSHALLQQAYEVAPNARAGGIWAPSGMSFDVNGNLFVSTGNSGATSGPPDDSESVVELSPSLTKLDSFTTSSWQSDNANDLDLGSTGPPQLASGLVFAVGKNGNGYLLDGTALHGVGGQLAAHPLCASFGGTAYDGGSNLYVPCTNGVTQVHINVTAHDFSVGWKQSKASKPPILAGGLLWSIGGSTLYGMDPTNGNVVTQLPLSAQPHSFETPTADQGHLFVPSDTTLDTFTVPVGSMAVMGTDNGLWSHHPGTGWISLGGALLGAPAVVPIPSVSGPSGTVDFYIAVGTDHTLWARTDGVGWKPLSPSFTSCLDNPAAAMMGTTLAVACLGSDQAVWYGTTVVDPNAFPSIPGFSSLGGMSSSGPAISAINGTFWYYVVGTDGQIWQRPVSSGWGNLAGTSCKGHPAAGSAGSTFYIACHGSDDALWYAIDGPGFLSAGGTLIDGPGLAAFPSQVAFTVEGLKGEVFQNVVTTSSSTGWIDQSGVAQHGAAAANF